RSRPGPVLMWIKFQCSEGRRPRARLYRDIKAIAVCRRRGEAWHSAVWRAKHVGEDHRRLWLGDLACRLRQQPYPFRREARASQCRENPEGQDATPSGRREGEGHTGRISACRFRPADSLITPSSLRSLRPSSCFSSVRGWSLTLAPPPRTRRRASERLAASPAAWK